jgi:hypothetical protein
MVQKVPRLTRRTVLLVKMEATEGVDPVPSAATDAVLVEAPDYTENPTVLKRDFVRFDLSPIDEKIGRIIAGMKFTCEVRGNGSEQSGAGTGPLLGRLLRACGYAETLVPTGGLGLNAVRAVGTHVQAVTWAGGGSFTGGTQMYDFLVTCVLGGASATAKLRVDDLNGYSAGFLKNEAITCTVSAASSLAAVVSTASPLAPTIVFSGTPTQGDVVNFNVNGFVGQYVVGAGPTTTTVAVGVAAAIAALDATLSTTSNTTNTTNVLYTGAGATGVVVTSGSTALPLGTSGMTITPTWASNLVIGEQWKVSVTPTGFMYTPVSQNFESVTLYLYLDGILHKITGARGTFTMAAEAGNYGKMTFEFMGNRVDPIDAQLPVTAVYESTLPPQFHLAQVRMDSEDITIKSFSFDQKNTLAPRDDANSLNGYAGIRITDRDPSGGVDPEVTFLGDFDFWGRMKNSTSMQFSLQFGSTAGNTIWVKAPKVQYTKLSYKDRAGIRVYDAGLSFAREAGNDEVVFFLA